MEDLKNNLKAAIDTIFADVYKEIEEEYKKHFYKQESIKDLQAPKEEVLALLEKLSVYIDRERESLLELEKITFAIRNKLWTYNTRQYLMKNLLKSMAQSQAMMR